MEKTAEVFNDQGQQAMRLPEDAHLSGDHVLVREDKQTDDDILSHTVETERPGDFEKLFQMLDELGPAPEEFMLGLCDPTLEREARDIFGDEDDSL